MQGLHLNNLMKLVTLVMFFSEMVSGARWARLKTAVLHATASFCALTAISKSHTCTHQSAYSFETCQLQLFIELGERNAI